MSDFPPLLCTNLVFGWHRDNRLIDISHFAIAPRETVFLQGPSGTGKSTLLGLVSGVLEAEGGSVKVLGNPLEGFTRGKRDRFRGEHIGYIAQNFNLLPHLSVYDNVVLPLVFSPVRRHVVERLGGTVSEALRLLSALGIDEQAANRPAGNLSQGQQQRVAAARALLGRPPLVIADEPTSALDTDNRDRFLELFLRECAEAGAAVLFVSHDQSLAHNFERILNFAEIKRVRYPCC